MVTRSLTYLGTGGLLAEHEASSLLTASAQYPYIIEMKNAPPHEALEKVLKVQKWSHEGDHGRETHETTLAWRYGARWLALNNEEDYKTILREFASLVRNPRPFSVTISSG